MGLKDIEEKLYNKKPDSGELDDLRSFEKLPSDDESNPFAPTFFKTEKKEDKSAIWIKEDEEKKEKRRKIKKIAAITGISLLVFAGLVWGFLVIRKSAFSESKVSVAINGPERTESGKESYFEIEYKNPNQVSLREAVIHISFPENFKLDNSLGFESEGPNTWRYVIGTVNSNSGGKIPLRGKFFGPRNLLVYINVLLEYSSFNFSSRFTAEGKTGIFITSSPLFFEMTGPPNAASGDTVSFKIKYKNNGQSNLGNLSIKAEYPNGFSFQSSEPLPAGGNNSWYAGDLSPGQEGEIIFSGRIEGQADEVRKFKASIGEGKEGLVEYGNSESNVKIVGSPITIEQTINGKKDGLVVKTGDTLTFKIRFQNSGQVGLRDVILTEEIRSPILDFSKISMSGTAGSVDAASGTISWRTAGFPALEVLNPGEGGEVTFLIPVKDAIPVGGVKDKNFSFFAVARMDSPDIPSSEGANKTVKSNAVEVRLLSKIGIAVEGYYNDPEISNSGPIPLQVGEETTFTMHLKIINISNDVSGARVTTTLPQGIRWKKAYLPKDENVTVDERSGKLVWEVGALPAGIGVITEPRELVFQIGATPNQNLVGNYMPLLGKTVFEAHDMFTNQDLRAEVGEKDSNLREDLGVGDAGKVIN